MVRLWLSGCDAGNGPVSLWSIWLLARRFHQPMLAELGIGRGANMGLKITQVDAFTSQPFRGNPAAVCVLPQPRRGSWMQLVAREMNLSETAFLHRQNDGYGLRWFTPTVEVALCGHATLASAHVLWEEGHLSPDEQSPFHTQSGLLTASRAAECDGRRAGCGLSFR